MTGTFSPFDWPSLTRLGMLGATCGAFVIVQSSNQKIAASWTVKILSSNT